MSPHLVELGQNAYTVSGAMLFPGFRFDPNEIELIAFLRWKNMNQIPHLVKLIPEIDMYACKDLPGELLKKYLPPGELELYFFCPIERKYSNGSRINRSTEIGNWKPTGNDRIHFGQLKVKSLVFHERKDKKTKRQNWVMHEYTLLDIQHSVKKEETAYDKVEYALCKLFEKTEQHSITSNDNQQTGASSGRTECTENSILIIPESHMSMFHLEESFPRTTSNNECAASVQGNSGTSEVEVTKILESHLDGVGKEVEIDGDDLFILLDDDTDLEALSLPPDNDTDLEEEICTFDALKRHSDIMLLEDGLLNLHHTDQDLGASGSDHHYSCFQDSQHIEKELMDNDLDIDLVDGIANSHLHIVSHEMHAPSFDYECVCMTHELASSWVTDGNINAVAESPCLALSDGICLSDMRVDEFWDPCHYPRTLQLDTVMEDLCGTAQLWD